MAAAGALMSVCFACLCIYVAIHARGALAEAKRVGGLVGEATRTSIRDAPPKGRVILSGRVVGAGGAVVKAPFSGAEALWACASAQTNVGQVLDTWVVAVDELVLDDGSGRVARVELGGASVRLEKRPLLGPEEQRRALAHFESIERSPSSHELYYEAVLRPGETVSVLGTLTPSAGGGYRENASALEHSRQAGGIIVYDEAREDAEPARRKRNFRLALLGVAFFGALACLFGVMALR